MDTKKLNQWADLLLDTGKRNPLIHFRDTRTSTAEVVFPSPELLFEKIDGAASFEVFDPNIPETADGQEEDSGTEPAQTGEPRENPDADTDGKSAFLARYSGKLKRQNQILLYHPAVNPMAAVKKIDQKAREYVEETGVNVAYMAFGFIHWKENDSSGDVFRAPLLLVPVQLEQASAADPYFITSAEDDILVNPTFSYKIQTEYGIKLPAYNEEGLTAYLEKARRLAAKLQWTVSSECKIGIFSFLKINMYRDLKDNAAAILANPNVRMLLGEPADRETKFGIRESAAPVPDPLIELHSVVDADSSQIEAIEMAKSGKSFVLQGPPGTGKSQTITNIIAECLSDGKKVLFVSEKLAALNVVYEKLKQAGLSEFCLQLHSHKANKKEVIADICHTLHMGKSAVSSRANSEIETKRKAERQLDAYAIELHKQRPGINKSLYQLYESYAALQSMPDVPWTVPDLPSKGEAYIKETASLLEQYADYIPSIGYDYRKNPWYGYIYQDTSFSAKSQVKEDFSRAVHCLQELIPLQKEISQKYKILCASLENARLWKTFFRAAAKSQILTPMLLRREVFNRIKPSLQDLRTRAAKLLSAREALSAVFNEHLWQLNGGACYETLTRQFDGTFSRVFNGQYRQLMAELRLCRRDGKKPSYREALEMTWRLADFQQQSLAYARAEAPVKGFLGAAYRGIDTDWKYVWEQLSAAETVFSGGISFGALAGGSYADFLFLQPALAKYAQNLEMILASCGRESQERLAEYFDSRILDIFSAPCPLVWERLHGCLGSMEQLDNWCHFRGLLFRLTEKQAVPYITAAIAQNVEPKQFPGAFRKQFYYQWMDSVWSGTPVLSAFHRISQDQAVRVFAEKDLEQFEINKARIRADLSARRPSLDLIAPGSALAVLLREGEKKRRLKSIRSLLAETGELVQRIKPCFLMSPLSVSTFLAPDSVSFDVAVFDEASQIFPQDAIGAIYRARQLIVVGDSRQMPPTNFFQASAETENPEEESEDAADFESILDLCSASMPQLRLRWHYRSRCEQLITFSNKNFYDGSLITFPSPRADAPGTGVDYYHAEGIFDRRTHTNRKEAEFIVELIYRNIRQHPDRSLGVVAFSAAQQDLIRQLLAKRRKTAPEQEFFFRRSAEEPFFIKNLETVQGDERDTIIFSVAYGIDSQGRLLHHFGPLNRAGGERRLNVAVTRAKYNIQVVSSMHDTDIDLNRTSAEGVRLLREYLDFAENGRIPMERAEKVNPFDQSDSDFEMEVCGFLRSRGYSVDTRVGCSDFQIDLALKLPGSSDYALAVECDGAAYHSSGNARDRDRLRQEILERMGWKFYRIWSTDWFRNKAVEQSRLLEAAADALETSSAAEEKPEAEDPPEEIFEEAAEEKPFEFSAYQTADLQEVCRRHPGNFKAIVKDILEVEAPLSEELLLKRMVRYFGREKITSVVQRTYEQQMEGCGQYGILRRNGFLYLEPGKEISFRARGPLEREIRQIAPEELAAGMLEILRQNVTAERTGLYRLLAAQCGVTRLGRSVNEAMDAALGMLERSDSVTVEGGQISLSETSQTKNIL